MSKDDSAPGLLSKMLKFVSNPATSWSDLDSVPADRDDSVSKQLLKEMMERKRRNDFVRKREFDMLRKLRKRDAMAGLDQEPGGRPSFFQSSMHSRPDDRASTVKKIDDIEAQMSMQWWKTKNNDPSDSAADSSLSLHGSGPETQAPLLENALPLAYRPTGPAGLPLGASVGVDATLSSASFPARTRSVGAGQGMGFDGTVSGFTPSRAAAVDFRKVVAHDAELEDAAIRFANGDETDAEAGLLEILAPSGARAGHAETWLMLFDLYRATGAQDKFESAAIEFIERFDRSAPQWFSMPDMVKRLVEPAGKAANGAVVDWVCPSVLGIQAVAALTAALAQSPMPWLLDWNTLKTIDAAAVEPLRKVFSSWASQPVQLQFMGDAQLQKVLQNVTPSGRRDIDPSWWALRMEALRITHGPDDCELVALDFCMTYEVSPPALERARCVYKSLEAEGDVVWGQTIIGDAPHDSMQSIFGVRDGDTQSAQIGGPVVVELSGQIQGDVVAVIETLETRLLGADKMLISCAKLIRVDFSAAGMLLNWVSACEAEMRPVQFLDVNRLVASFFNVIGITEHANVQVRID